jgi:hypothetical protein
VERMLGGGEVARGREVGVCFGCCWRCVCWEEDDEGGWLVLGVEGVVAVVVVVVVGMSGLKNGEGSASFGRGAQETRFVDRCWWDSLSVGFCFFVFTVGGRSHGLEMVASTRA